MSAAAIVGRIAAGVSLLAACICLRKPPALEPPAVVSALPSDVYLLADPGLDIPLMLGRPVRVSALGHVLIMDLFATRVRAVDAAAKGELRSVPDASLPQTFMRAGWLAYFRDSDDAIQRALPSFARLGWSQSRGCEVTELRRSSWSGTSSADEPIVGAVLTGSLQMRCPVLAGFRCHEADESPMHDATLAIVVQRPVRPWAELAIDEGDAAPWLREGEHRSLPIHALPDTFLVLRLREPDGRAHTLWRGGPRPDPDRQPRWHGKTQPAVAPLYSPSVRIPETQAKRPRCARIELDIVSAPWVDRWPDPHRDPAGWDRFIPSLPDSRWRRIVRDVVVMPSRAASSAAQAPVPDCG